MPGRADRRVKPRAAGQVEEGGEAVASSRRRRCRPAPAGRSGGWPRRPGRTGRGRWRSGRPSPVLFDLVAEANLLIVRLERGDTAAAGELGDRFATFLDLFDLVAEANPLIVRLERGDTGAAAELRDRFATFLDLAGRLGFSPLDDLPDPAAFRPLLDLLLDLRERARAARDFAAADAIRDRLASAGIRVEDRPGGPRWHLAP